MFGQSKLEALERWVDRHEELLQLATKAIPYIPPPHQEHPAPSSPASPSVGSVVPLASHRQGALPYDRAADIVAALTAHIQSLRTDVTCPLADDLQKMSKDISIASKLLPGSVPKNKTHRADAAGMHEAEDVHDDRWLAALQDVSFQALVKHAAAPNRNMGHVDFDEEEYRLRRQRGRDRGADETSSVVHPTLQRLLRMTPEALEQRRAELEAERRLLHNELSAEEEAAAAAAAAGEPNASPKSQRSASSVFQAAVSKTSLAFRFLKKDSTSGESKKLPAPFPYAFEVIPTCTFLRKLVKTLHEGNGSTVLAVDFTTGFPIVRGILEEAEDVFVGLTEFAKAMTKDGLRAVVSIREAKPHGSTEGTLRKEAEHRQYQRHFRGSAVLAKRSSDAIKERLSFAADRPKGLLETLAADMAPVVTCTFSDSIAPPGGPPFSLFYPRSGMQVVYFSTRSDADSFVTISVSPWLLCPESYAMCSIHPMYGGCVPQNWVLEGSNDGGQTFTVLRRHTNDDSFLRGSDFAVFDIPPISFVNPLTKETTTRRFIGSLFRVRCTGENALGSLNLQIAALEFYGRAMTCLEVPPIQEASRPIPASFFGDTISKTLTYGVPMRGSAVGGTSKGFKPLPPQPPDAPAGGGKAKKKK